MDICEILLTINKKDANCNESASKTKARKNKKLLIIKSQKKRRFLFCSVYL